MKHWKSAAIALFLAAWFLGHTWRGLLIYFTGDDMMNTHQAWVLPLGKLLGANLTPFSNVFRPFGSLYYRGMYTMFGFHPLDFRIVTYAFMLANVFLIFRLARQVTGSAEIGVLTAVLGSYHPRLMDMYVTNGTVYDVLACTFVLLALSFYMQARPVWFLVTYVVALNSKEMAAAVPLILLIYDWAYRRKPGSIALWISLAITAISVEIKRSGAALGVADFGIHFTLHQFLSTARPLLSDLFYLDGRGLNNTWTVLILVGIWGMALAVRSKPLLFAAAFATFAPLPINFVVYRGFYVMYVPMIGWALYLATALVQGRDWLLKTVWKRPPLIEGHWEPERIALVLFVAYALFDVQSRDRIRSFDQLDPSQANIRTLKQGLDEFAPRLSPGARILLLHDPFPREYYDPLFVARLVSRDRAIEVDRDERRPGEKYDLILDYRDGRYQPVPF